jgi:hypothetical protein
MHLFEMALRGEVIVEILLVCSRIIASSTVEPLFCDVIIPVFLVFGENFGRILLVYCPCSFSVDSSPLIWIFDFHILVPVCVICC